MGQPVIESLRRAVRAWWVRGGMRLDVVDVATVARQPWAQAWSETQVGEAILDLLGWIINEGDCPACECSGYMADPTSRSMADRPCEICHARWDLGDDWRGPRVVMGGVERCPACEAQLDNESDECPACGHEPRGEAMAKKECAA